LFSRRSFDKAPSRLAYFIYTSRTVDLLIFLSELVGLMVSQKKMKLWDCSN
jgi:hypothetical protein